MVVLSSLVAALAGLAVQALAAPAANPVADFTAKFVDSGYIVKLKPSVAVDADQGHLSWVQGLHSRSLRKRDLPGLERQFNLTNFHGYSGRFDEATISEIKKSDDVLYVVKDKMVYLDFVHTEPPKVMKRDVTSQDSAPWGLAAVSHRSPGPSSYLYDTKAGEDTWAYILDTGVRVSHSEFEGRATAAWSAFWWSNRDDMGHGTHVAGTVAGKTFGVAKKANVVAVKVLNFAGGGSTSGIMAGIEWSVDDIVSKGRQNKAVLNLSLGADGDTLRPLNDIIEAGFQQGVVSVVAAGNELQDADNVSPARTPSAITVGAVNSTWNFADHWVLTDGSIVGSNYGPVVDIFAPGQDVESASYEGDNLSSFKTGTSMASPHVAGLVLYAFSVDGVTGAKGVTDHVLSTASKGVVKGNLRGSPNLLANNNNPQQ